MPCTNEVVIVSRYVSNNYPYKGQWLTRYVQGIFLVGGFGSSRYLKERLKRVYDPLGIQVIQPHDAWGAIVK